MGEIWKDIEGYEGLYQVSNLGRVKSLKYNKERILKIANGTDGYKIVGLTYNSKRKTFKVHRLVAQAFIPNPNEYPQVNHKDEDKGNNKVDNLEWCDNKYNCNYGNHIKNCTGHNKRKVICTTTNEKFNSIVEASEKYNIDAADIVHCCQHKRLTSGKIPNTNIRLSWKYIEE